MPVVVSILLIILRMSGLRLSQKLRIGFFLCLSCTMIIICIVRLTASLNYKRGGSQHADIVYTNILGQIGNAVAVIMGSISALRVLFAGKDEPEHRSPAGILISRILILLRLSKDSRNTNNYNSGFERGQNVEKNINNDLAQGAFALNSLKTYIRAYNRTTGNIAVGSVSEEDVVDGYHAFRREEMQEV
jgi:hypothetical protein